jgi:hypothetical protein
VTGFGLKLTLEPAGTPPALSATVCAEPLVTAVEIVELPLLPWATVMVLGLALIEKSSGGGVVTVSETVVECVALEPAPVIVSVYPPVGVAAPTFTVIVDEPPAVTGFGLKLTLVPEGTPAVALSATVCAEPLVTAVEIVEAPLLPWATVMLLGLALIEKSSDPGAVTVRPTDVVCVTLPSVPVTVIV